MNKKLFISFFLVFFASCSQNSEKWSDIFIKEETSSSEDDYCKYNNIFLENKVFTTYENKKIEIIGVSSRTCKDNLNGIVTIDRYYALININNKSPKKLRIVFPAYMSLSTGNESYYDKFRKDKRSLSISYSD